MKDHRWGSRIRTYINFASPDSKSGMLPLHHTPVFEAPSIRDSRNHLVKRLSLIHHLSANLKFRGQESNLRLSGSKPDCHANIAPRNRSFLSFRRECRNRTDIKWGCNPLPNQSSQFALRSRYRIRTGIKRFCRPSPNHSANPPKCRSRPPT